MHDIKSYPTLKFFIEEHIDLIDNNNWDTFYRLANLEFTNLRSIGVLTEILLEAGINPLEYITGKIPEGYLADSDSVTDSNFYLPDTTEIIGKGAFAWCMNLRNVQLPDSVRLIGQHAFAGCAFNEFILSKNIVQIGPNAFSEADCPILIYPDSRRRFKQTKLHLSNPRASIWRKDSNIQIIRCTDGDINLEY